MNSRFTASLGLRYDLEDVPLDEQGEPEFSTRRVSRSTRTTSRRASAAPRRSTTRHGGRARRIGTLLSEDAVHLRHAVVSAGVISDSFIVQLCAPRRNNCPSATQVDPGPSAGRLPTEPVPRQRAGRESRAAERAVPPGDAGEEHRHGAVRQSGSPSAVLAPGERRIREAALAGTWPSAPTTSAPNSAICTCCRS